MTSWPTQGQETNSCRPTLGNGGHINQFGFPKIVGPPQYGCFRKLGVIRGPLQLVLIALRQTYRSLNQPPSFSTLKAQSFRHPLLGSPFNALKSDHGNWLSSVLLPPPHSRSLRQDASPDRRSPSPWPSAPPANPARKGLTVIGLQLAFRTKRYHDPIILSHLTCFNVHQAPLVKKAGVADLSHGLLFPNVRRSLGYSVLVLCGFFLPRILHCPPSRMAVRESTPRYPPGVVFRCCSDIPGTRVGKCFLDGETNFLPLRLATLPERQNFESFGKRNPSPRLGKLLIIQLRLQRPADLHLATDG